VEAPDILREKQSTLMSITVSFRSIELVLPDHGEEAFGCTHTLTATPTPTLRELAAKAVEFGLPLNTQRIVIFPVSILTDEDIAFLCSKPRPAPSQSAPEAQAEENLEVDVAVYTEHELSFRTIARFTDSHTLLDVADKCVPEQGLLHRMIFAPKAVIEKLKKATNHKHGIQAMHGFVPPVKQSATKDVRDSIQCLQEFKFDVVYGGAFAPSLRDELRLLCRSAEGMLRDVIARKLDEIEQQAARPPPPLTEGLKVMVKRDDVEAEQCAVISCVQPDGTFDIKYDDGEQGTRVRAETLRPFPESLVPQDLRTVVYELRSAYREVYTAVHGLICVTDGASLRRLEADVHSTPGLIKSPEQTTDDLADLLESAFVVKATRYDPFFEGIEGGDKERLKFEKSKLKGIWRCIEKMKLTPQPVDSCRHICDVVRGAICSDSVAALANVYEILRSSRVINIVRVKNRMRHPNDSGWADCLINFTFRDDDTKHVCEVQLVHTKLFLVSKNMGAHDNYSFFRSALELLEATDTSGAWKEECALVQLYFSCRGPEWRRAKNWSTSQPLHSWEGVILQNDGKISDLLLNGNNLKGQ
jgi:hypothetical protein